MKIYLDTCALNRLADAETTDRVRNEAVAVIRIFDLVASGKLLWIASTVVLAEVQRNPDVEQRTNTLALFESATEVAAPDRKTTRRALELEASGLRGLDALHLAVAEQAECDWLVTTDDRFLHFGGRNRLAIKVELINPVELIQRRSPWLVPRR